MIFSVNNPATPREVQSETVHSTIYCVSAARGCGFLKSFKNAETRKPISSKPANRNQRG
jgi:hypothetical protein